MVLVLAACSDPGPGTVSPYDRAPVPAVPDRTAPVAEDGPLVDGDYWGIISGANSGEPSPTITFTLVQASFDANGSLAVTDEPSRVVTGAAADLQSLSVVAESRQNYAVPADELISLALANEPSADAPDDYAWVDYPFLVTLRNGVVVEARQIWIDETTSG